MDRLPKALASGLVGAVTLNLLHESARRVIPEAPQVHRVAMNAIAGPMLALGKEPPPEDALYRWALAGDMLSNGAYYGMVGLGNPRGSWLRGALLGLAAGVGAAVLPGPLGLGGRYVARTPATRAMTVAWYLIGGLAAAAAYRSLDDT